VLRGEVYNDEHALVKQDVFTPLRRKRLREGRRGSVAAVHDIDDEEGDEEGVYVDVICPECDAVLDGSEHVQGCTWVDPESALDPMDMFEPGPGD
jgi:hypothetical protein